MLALHRRGDVRATIELVDRWLDDGDPTVAARLAQADALDRLGLIDRAWSCLLAVPESAGLPRARLEARIAAHRETPGVARARWAALVTRYPGDAELEVVGALLDAPPAPVAEPPIDAPLDVALDAATAMLASGAHVRARRLVDGVASRHRATPRLRTLLWAVHGGAGIDRATAEAVVERALRAPLAPAPAVEPLADDVDLDDATQITRLDLGDDSVDDADGPAETTQIVRIVNAEASGAWTPPVRAPLPVEDDGDRVVFVARRPTTPPTLRRPLPAPEVLSDDDLPELDAEGMEELDALEPLDDRDVRPRAAPPVAGTSSTALAEEAAPIGLVVVVALGALVVGALGLGLLGYALVAR